MADPQFAPALKSKGALNQNLYWRAVAEDRNGARI